MRIVRIHAHHEATSQLVRDACFAALAEHQSERLWLQKQQWMRVLSFVTAGKHGSRLLCI
jgi:hypothetical protein